MKKLIFISLLLVLSFGVKNALADIEAPSTAISKLVKNPETLKDQIETAYAQFQKKYEQVIQGYQEAKKAYDKAKDVINDPFGTGISLAQKLQKGLQKKNDEGSPDEEVAEDVKDTYSRKENEGIEAAVAHQQATNLLLIDNTAALFAKALVLRQKIRDEELDEPDMNDIETVMRLSSELKIKSLERWNEVLKMQAHISAYKNFLENQNYKVEEDQTAEAQNEK